jgi:hypothetical protein
LVDVLGGVAVGTVGAAVVPVGGRDVSVGAEDVGAGGAVVGEGVAHPIRATSAIAAEMPAILNVMSASCRDSSLPGLHLKRPDVAGGLGQRLYHRP